MHCLHDLTNHPVKCNKQSNRAFGRNGRIYKRYYPCTTLRMVQLHKINKETGSNTLYVRVPFHICVQESVLFTFMDLKFTSLKVKKNKSWKLIDSCGNVHGRKPYLLPWNSNLFHGAAYKFPLEKSLKLLGRSTVVWLRAARYTGLNMPFEIAPRFRHRGGPTLGWGGVPPGRRG